MADTEKINVDIDTGTATNSVKNLRKEFADLKKELYGLQEGTEEYNDVLKKTADKGFQLRETNELIKQSAGDIGQVFQNTTRVLAGAAAGFTVVTSSMQLLGVENKTVGEGLLKVQSAMALMQGLEGFEGMFKSLKNLTMSLGLFKKATIETTVAQTEAAVASKTTTAGLEVQTVATESTTFATKALKVALVSLGIGAIIVGLGLLIANFEKIAAWFKSSEVSAKELADNFKNINFNSSVFTDLDNLVIGISKVRQELDFLTAQFLNNDIDIKDYVKQYNTLLAQQSDDAQKLTKNLLDNKKEFIKQNEEFNSTITDGYKLSSQSIEKVNEDYNNLLKQSNSYYDALLSNNKTYQENNKLILSDYNNEQIKIQNEFKDKTSEADKIKLTKDLEDSRKNYEEKIKQQNENYRNVKLLNSFGYNDIIKDLEEHNKNVINIELQFNELKKKLLNENAKQIQEKESKITGLNSLELQKRLDDNKNNFDSQLKELENLYKNKVVIDEKTKELKYINGSLSQEDSAKIEAFRNDFNSRQLKETDNYLNEISSNYGDSYKNDLQTENDYYNTKKANLEQLNISTEQLTIDHNKKIAEIESKKYEDSITKQQDYIKNYKDLELNTNKFISETKLNEVIKNNQDINKLEQDNLTNKFNNGLIKEQEYTDAKNKLTEESLLKTEQLTDTYNKSIFDRNQTFFNNQLAATSNNVLSQFTIKATALEAQRQEEIRVAELTGQDISVINAKYDQLDLENKRASRDQKLALAQEGFQNISNTFASITEFEQQSATDRQNEELNKLQENYGKGLISKEQYEKEKVGIESKANKERKKIQDKYAAIQKTAAVIAATVDTYRSATSAYASLAGIPVVGPVLGAIAAGAAVAAGLANIRKIMATPTNTDTSQSVGGTPSASSTSATEPTGTMTNVSNTIKDNTIQPTRYILNKSEEEKQNQSMKVYVVESDISKAQNKVKVVESESRI